MERLFKMYATDLTATPHRMFLREMDITNPEKREKLEHKERVFTHVAVL